MLPRAVSTAARASKRPRHTVAAGVEGPHREALDNALDAAAYARESGEAAYLERDPADRPPPSAFIAFYEAAALRALEAALAALPPDAAADARVADAMLARDRLAASVGRSGAGEEAWPE